MPDHYKKSQAIFESYTKLHLNQKPPALTLILVSASFLFYNESFQKEKKNQFVCSQQSQKAKQQLKAFYLLKFFCFCKFYWDLVSFCFPKNLSFLSNFSIHIITKKKNDKQKISVDQCFINFECFLFIIKIVLLQKGD